MKESIKSENENDYKVEYIGRGHSDKLKTYKINIIGLNGVGKSSISFRIINNKFQKNIPPTISVDVGNFQVKVNEEIIQLQLWDACGNEEFIEKTPNLFRDTYAAIIVYAINDRKSFFQIEKWNNILSQYTFECIKFLIGNKSDLEDSRVVSKEEGEKLREDYDFKLFIETSAKEGFNITNLINNIAISIYQKRKENEEIICQGTIKSRIILNDFKKVSNQKRKKKCC